MRWLTVAACLAAGGTVSMQAQDRTQARSMVISQFGIVATSQTLASQAGAQILARGGSAADAAIAANAVLAVVEPMMNGIGGDLFALTRDARTGRLAGLNSSGWAPQGLSIGYLNSIRIHDMTKAGIHTVTVPGCVEGWAQLHERAGRLPWRELFGPAIFYAEHGFPVTEIIAHDWEKNAHNLATEAGRQVFLPAPHVGQVFRNPRLGRALELIAQSGPEAFYRGPIAEALLATSRELHGTMSAADLSEFHAEWVEPIHIEYRGWKVYELPPNGQGIAALEMLNLMQHFPLGSSSAADDLHIEMEAQKLAYADLLRYVADPRFSRTPVAGLLSKEYTAERVRLIDARRARCEAAPGKPPETRGDTIYLAAVDRDGNIVSLIQSIYHAFGSGIVVGEYGFPLQDRGGLFVLDSKHPNALQPRKRPLHTIIPAYMEKGSVHLGFGIMGGFNQAQAHAQFVSNVVDHQMNIQAALEAPRFTKLTFGGCDVKIERRVPEAVRKDLESRGHKLEVVGSYDSDMGGGQAVLYDSQTGVKYAGSSPRKDGAAIPEPPPE